MEFEILRKILADLTQTEEDGIHMTTKFVEDLGMNSLELTRLIVSAEKKFGISLLGLRLNSIVFVSDLVEYIRVNGKKQNVKMIRK